MRVVVRDNVMTDLIVSCNAGRMLAMATASALFTVLACRTRVICRAVLVCRAGAAPTSVTNERWLVRLLGGSRDHEVGRSDAVLAGPHKLLLVVHTAAMVPALVSRCATARVVLARIGTGAIFSHDPHDRNAADLEQDADQEKKSNRLPGKVVDRFSWEPNAHAENPPLSPEATERTAPIQTLARHNTLVSRVESIIRANFLNSGDRPEGPTRVDGSTRFLSSRPDQRVHAGVTLDRIMTLYTLMQI
jgi:hypothetical protein